MAARCVRGRCTLLQEGVSVVDIHSGRYTLLQQGVSVVGTHNRSKVCPL